MATKSNEFALTTSKQEIAKVGEEMANNRAIAEVQGRMVIAKRFPRDMNEVMERVKIACGRIELAKQAVYEYPRGGTKVTGPSIRLAEALSQCYHNMDTGVIELDQRNGESVMQAYSWDIESNTRDSKTFTVKHWRDTKQGGQALTDMRDIYEIAANMASRRKRACILATIPGDLVDMAQKLCEETLIAAQEDIPIETLVAQALTEFEKMGVSRMMIEKRLGHKVEACSRNEIVKLTSIYVSLQDGFGTVADYFEVAGSPTPIKESTKAKTDALKEKIDAFASAPNAPAPVVGLEEFLKNAIAKLAPPVTLDDCILFLRAEKGMSVVEDLDKFALKKPKTAESIRMDIGKFFSLVADAKG